MKFFILAVGNKMPEWIRTGYSEYVKRLPREITVNLIEIKPEKRVSGKQIEQLLFAEYQRILAALPSDCRVIILDERGQQCASVEFASIIRRWTMDGRAVAFVIGSADGLHNNIKNFANEMIALSRMTLPHGFVRVLLAEQIYRAISIIKDHPYHRV
jgi:23S rRNA (pseudouridine1915-N3)-methyltransferase